MIRAGALTYAIFVMVVAGVLCLLMISQAYMNRSYFIKVDQRDVVRDNANSGIALAMALEGDSDQDEWHDLYKEGHDSVRVKRRRWGAYQLVASKAVKGKELYLKSCIYGYENASLHNVALWLADRNRPLQLTGKALLRGNCKLPEKGVDRAYVEGTNFKGDKLVHGAIETSKELLPQPEQGLSEYWLEYLKGNFTPVDSVVSVDQLPAQLSHSFHKRTLLASSEKPIKLSGEEIEGNVIIYSNYSIEVQDSRLDHVILIAPKITIRGSYPSRLHLIASDSVIIDEETELLYPSTLLTISRGLRMPYTLLSKGAEFGGVALCFSEGLARSNKLMLEIEEGANLRGLVYCEDNFELGGKVEGNVFANRFLLATPSGIYENHILNGKIDRKALRSSFGGIRFEDLEHFAKPITWLSY